MANSISDLEKQLNELRREHLAVQEQVRWMVLLLRQIGADGGWVSPQMAGIATGRSADRVKDDIYAAEKLRFQGKKSDLVYGEHYRNDQTPNSSQPTWKVHLLSYLEYTKIPPDQIKVA